MGVVRLEAVEPAPFQRIVFDVAAAALLLAVFLRPPRLRGQRRKAPVLRKRGVDVVDVRIVETRAGDARLQIVVPYDSRHAAQVAEGALVEPEKRLELLIPDRLFVAVA